MAKSGRGNGSIHLRMDGRWEGRYVIGYDEKRLPKTKNVLARTKKECQQKLKELRQKEKVARSEMITVKPDVTFGEWMDLWYRECCKPGIRPKTQADYENRIYQHIIPELGHIPLAKLNQSDLQQFYARLKEGGRLIRTEQNGPGLSDRMIKGCHTVCRMALDKAVEQGLIVKNPAASCKAPATHPKEMQILTPQEVQRLMIQAKEDDCFELLLLELSTGLRRGEILALQWDDLDCKTGELWIERQVQRVEGELVISAPKTAASNRSIILPPLVVEALKSLKENTHSCWIFPSPRKDDSPQDPAAVRKKLSKTLERAGCKHVRFHDLRHLFATNALEHGMDIKTLSTIIGHVSSHTTLNVYAHVTDEMQAQAAAMIDRGITGAETPQEPTQKKETPRTTFQAARGKYRKPGTGHISRISENLWEGRYSPKVNGKRVTRNVYAPTEAECEERLAAMIVEMSAEIAVLKKSPRPRE